MQDAFKEAVGIQDYDHRQHSLRFRRWIRANANHRFLAPFDGVGGIWEPLFIHGQAIVLCIKMQVTATFESTTPFHVIQEAKEMCSRSHWLMWFVAVCDMMVSDLDGNRDDDLTEKKKHLCHASNHSNASL